MTKTGRAALRGLIATALAVAGLTAAVGPAAAAEPAYLDTKLPFAERAADLVATN